MNLKENTITQILQEPKYKTKKEILPKITQFLQSSTYEHNIPTERISSLAKWLTFQIQNINYPIPETRQIIQKYRDFITYALTSQYDKFKSKLNNPQYSINNLEEDSEKWHVHISSQERQPAAQGRTINTPNMPSGWKWVSLDKIYCSEEAKAMGHCGNRGGKKGDNILSLRDPKGIAHLTFIVNNKILGESKGYGNNKPTKSYHPMIKSLLLATENGQPIIQYIQGGGYAPENNFDFNDFDKNTQEEILKIKPYINNFMLYLKLSNSPKKIKNELSQYLGITPEKISFKNNTITIKTFQDIQELINFIKQKTSSKLEELPDLDEYQPIDYRISKGTIIDNYKYSANKETQKLIEKIIKMQKEKNINIEWLYDNITEIEEALSTATLHGEETGMQDDMYKTVIKELNNQTDKTGLFTMQNDPKKPYLWTITCNINDIEYAIKNDTGEYLLSNAEFEYKQPYYGYNGFNEEVYNQSLQEELNTYIAKNKKQKKSFQEWLQEKNY